LEIDFVVHGGASTAGEYLHSLVVTDVCSGWTEVVRLYVNYFQPSFKLRERVRENGRIKKLYHSPATSCDRLLAHAQVEEEVKGRLRAQGEQLDPLELMHRMRQGQSALAALSARESCLASERQSLNEFLVALPKLCELGEVRPTHRQAPMKPRWWRSREDPFKDVWAEVLLWLQSEPDSTGKALFERLRQRYPDRFQAGQLRTLQRRISEWRLTMARKLVLGGVEQQHAVEAVAESAAVV